MRQAIADALAGDTITFAVQGTITLTSDSLTIDKNLAIEGPGAKKLTVSGNRARRVFVILPGMSVTLSRITISDGLADGNSPVIPSFGGGILNGASAKLTLSNVVVSDNQALGDANKARIGYPGAAFASGVVSFGTLEVTNSSFRRNLARGADDINVLGTSYVVAGFGGCGAIFSTGKLTVIQSRFTHNQGIGAASIISAPTGPTAQPSSRRTRPPPAKTTSGHD